MKTAPRPPFLYFPLSKKKNATKSVLQSQRKVKYKKNAKTFQFQLKRTFLGFSFRKVEVNLTYYSSSVFYLSFYFDERKFNIVLRIYFIKFCCWYILSLCFITNGKFFLVRHCSHTTRFRNPFWNAWNETQCIFVSLREFDSKFKMNFLFISLVVQRQPFHINMFHNP